MLIYAPKRPSWLTQAGPQFPFVLGFRHLACRTLVTLVHVAIGEPIMTPIKAVKFLVSAMLYLLEARHEAIQSQCQRKWPRRLDCTHYFMQSLSS